MSLSSDPFKAILNVNVCGKDFELHRTADLESLWDAMTEQISQSLYDERIPYWTEIWPASLALCNWIYSQKNVISGKRCLDMGCGLGLTALVGMWLNATVLGMDYEEEALVFAKKNAAINNIDAPLLTVMDWRKPAIKKGSISHLWGGDIMYERGFVQPVLNFIDYALAADGVAWVAEPNRSVYAFFRAELVRRNWKARAVYEESVQNMYAEGIPVSVTVWEIQR